MKYKVSFSGFAYVEADSPEEAEEKAMYEDDAVYEEKKCESVEEVDEFTVSLENCMERLTYWNEEYGCWSYHGPSGEAAKRLAAYEETGLEPEEVRRCLEFEDICLDEYIKYERLHELAQADRMIGKEVWAQAKYLNIFQTKPSLIQRTTIQYVSLLKGGDILCHTQTCAFPLNEIGKTVFLTREEAALRREQDG